MRNRETRWGGMLCLLAWAGTAVVSFTAEPGAVSDIDGNVYQTVQIGDQVWMKENLRTTRYQDGTPIAHLPDRTEWRHTDQPAYVWPENDESNKEIYGALYNGYTVSRPGLCPPGWRVATDEDFKKLERYLEMSPEEIEKTGMRGTDQGERLKETAHNLWGSEIRNAIHSSGFSAVPAGRRWCNGMFQQPGGGTTFWTSTSNSFATVVYRHINRKYTGIGRNPNGENDPKDSHIESYLKYGYSVRCIQDEGFPEPAQK